jgi:hypothetical protein
MTAMRFDPDPFCVNEPLEKPRRVKRAITELSLDTQPQGPVLSPKSKQAPPIAPMLNPKFTPAPSQLNTTYDVHGCLDRGPRPAESIDLPPSLRWLVNAGAKVIAVAIWIFSVAVLATRGQRQHVIDLARRHHDATVAD